MSAICRVELNDPRSGSPEMWQLVTPTGAALALPAGATDANGHPIMRPGNQPMQAGDVLSVQPGPSSQPALWQARPADAIAAYETQAASGSLTTYCPDGKTPRAYLYLASVPNQ